MKTAVVRHLAKLRVQSPSQAPELLHIHRIWRRQSRWAGHAPARKRGGGRQHRNEQEGLRRVGNEVRLHSVQAPWQRDVSRAQHVLEAVEAGYSM